MLFHFLGLAYLECCLFSLVYANPMKEYLKTVGDASGSSSLPRVNSFRYSPYQKRQRSIQNAFDCPNGQAIDEKNILRLLSKLFITSLIELESSNIMVEKHPNKEKYYTFIYPISSHGSLVQQSQSKDSPIKYELVINQLKEPPFIMVFGGVYLKSGTERKECPRAPQRLYPFDGPILEELDKSVIDCNGVFFQPNQVEAAMLAAKKALLKEWTGNQLTPQPKAQDGFPVRFFSRIYPFPDAWMFPILPGTDSIYKEGDPGIYSVILTGAGIPLGVVYSKTREQILQEEKRYELWMVKPKIHRYGICEVKKAIQID